MYNYFESDKNFRTSNFLDFCNGINPVSISFWIRREFLDTIKKDEKNKIISQDDSKKYLNEVQKITDEHISKIDEIAKNKQSEIMKV